MAHGLTGLQMAAKRVPATAAASQLAAKHVVWEKASWKQKAVSGMESWIWPAVRRTGVWVANLESRWEVCASCRIASAGKEALERGWIGWALFEDEAGRGCAR